MNASKILNRARQVGPAALLLGSLFVILAACGDDVIAPTESRDDTFVVGQSPRIVVSNDNGRVFVSPGSDGTVRVQTTLRKPDDVEYQTVQEGDTVSVEANAIEKGFGIFNLGDSPGADIEITAPSATRIELRTSNGSVEVQGMQRSGSLRTSNGSIRVEDVKGDFDISTSNGAVTIARAVGSFDVETSNGRIEFDGELVRGGSNRMETSNGSVRVNLTGTPSVKIDASTVNGTVTTRLPILTTSTGGGRHVVGTIGTGDADLYARTTNGSVVVQ